MYSEVITNLINKLSESFCEVYHSAEQVTIFEDGQISDRFVAVNKQNNWLNLSPSDVKDTIYIRRNGDDISVKELQLGSCTKAFKMRTPLRIVYFKMYGNHGEALFKLMQSVLMQGLTINGIVQDKFRLLTDESTGAYNFGPKTIYLAIDVYAFWDLMPDTCEQDFCIEIENPVRKCEPIVENS
jgi:hypothetical protein